MTILKIQDYTVGVCSDIHEWGREFYGIPNDAEILNTEELSSECMGFAQIEDKAIWIFIPKEYLIKDLMETVAHEIGHIFEMKYPNNPELIESNNVLHESKADHFMNFYMLVNNIITSIVEILNK